MNPLLVLWYCENKLFVFKHFHTAVRFRYRAFVVENTSAITHYIKWSVLSTLINDSIAYLRICGRKTLQTRRYYNDKLSLSSCCTELNDTKLTDRCIPSHRFRRRPVFQRVPIYFRFYICKQSMLKANWWVFEMIWCLPIQSV